MLLSAETIAENLQKLTSEDSLPQPEMARRMGLSAKTYWTLKVGAGNPTLENLEKVAAYLNRPLWQLLVKDGHKLPCDFVPFNQPEPKIEVGRVRIAVLNAMSIAGIGDKPGEYRTVLDHIELAEPWAKMRLGNSLENVRALPVAGDSMSPTINEGDLAFVDIHCRRFKSEGIYVIMFNNLLLIKRLSADLSTKRIRVHSDNATHSPQQVHEDALTICGRVKAWLAAKSY